ncbi:MAG: Rieske (2Fe-2S) protein [Acidobacteria bacterium]|nr:Rieske (2Fe-2S) protein [Acidobacteriota bacterium]
MIVKLCNAADLPEEGGMKSFRGGKFEICVARCDGGLFAFDNKCPHQSAPLNCGELDGCMVVCPYHAWRFDVRSGEPEMAGDPPLVKYEVRQLEDEVFIQLPNGRD